MSGYQKTLTINEAKLLQLQLDFEDFYQQVETMFCQIGPINPDDQDNSIDPAILEKFSADLAKLIEKVAKATIAILVPADKNINQEKIIEKFQEYFGKKFIDILAQNLNYKELYEELERIINRPDLNDREIHEEGEGEGKRISRLVESNSVENNSIVKLLEMMFVVNEKTMRVLEIPGALKPKTKPTESTSSTSGKGEEGSPKK